MSQQAQGAMQQNNSGAMPGGMSQTLAGTLTHTVQLEKILSSSASLKPSYSTKVTAAEQRVDPAGEAERRLEEGWSEATAAYHEPQTTNNRCSSLRSSPRSIVAGSAYTAYIVSVIGPSGSNLIEHRFSEFHKLYLELSANKVTTPAPFPPKSLNGRIGNWTPSALLAPKSNIQLINERVIKLDQWLLGVVEKLYQGEIQNKTLRNEVIEFLEVRRGEAKAVSEASCIMR